MNDAQIKAVKGGPPPASAASARRSLGIAVGEDLEIPLLSLNRAKTAEIAAVAELPPALAAAVASGGPYYFSWELRLVPGMTEEALQRLLEVYSPPVFHFTDKLSQRPVRLEPKSTGFLIEKKQGEDDAANRLIDKLRLRRPFTQRGKRSPYTFVYSPQSETGVTALIELKKERSIAKVLPLFTDDHGRERFVDLEFCVAQFREDSAPAEQEAAIARSGLVVQERLRHPGLVILRNPNFRVDPSRTLEGVESLNQEEIVRFVEPSFVGPSDLECPAMASPSPPSAAPWHLAQMGASSPMDTGPGRPNIIVAIIDSGVADTHPALRGTLVDRAGDDWDFSGDGELPEDDLGHGTFIAGLLVGNGSGGVVGVCPGCKLLPLRVPLEARYDSYARRRDAILYALSKISAGRRLVINMSWRTDGDVALVRDAIQSASAAGAALVASAGNYPAMPDEAHFPSDYTSVISVGGVDSRGRRATFSYFGQQVDIAAPAGDGTDDTRTWLCSAGLDGASTLDYGTSFSTALVAGATALVWSVNPLLDSRSARAILEGTARPVSEYGLGHGTVDAEAAVDRAFNDLMAATLTPGEALILLNEAYPEVLVSRFGIQIESALAVAAARPHSSVETAASTTGLSAGDAARLRQAGGATGAPTVNPPRVNANTASFEAIAAIPAMPRFTARLVVQRRPYSSLSQLGAILGMTPDLLSRFSL